MADDGRAGDGYDSHRGASAGRDDRDHHHRSNAARGDGMAGGGRAREGDDSRRGEGAGEGVRTLWLVSRRQVNANNATRYVPAGRSAERAVALVHPDDAAAHGVGEGDAVEVRSASGRVTVTVRLDGGLRPGTVSVPHGWYDANVCRLTSAADIDPLTTQPQMSGYAVTLHRVHDTPGQREVVG